MVEFPVNPSRFDPYENFKFRLKWDGKYVAGVSEVSAFKRTTEVIEFRDGGDASALRKSPGRTEYDAIPAPFTCIVPAHSQSNLALTNSYVLSVIWMIPTKALFFPLLIWNFFDARDLYRAAWRCLEAARCYFLDMKRPCWRSRRTQSSDCA